MSFGAETEQGVAQAIIRSVLDFKRDPWPKVSENAKDLVKKMLDPDPRRRLTAREVLGNIMFNVCTASVISDYRKLVELKITGTKNNFFFFTKYRPSLVAKCKKSSKCFSG